MLTGLDDLRAGLIPHRRRIPHNIRLVNCSDDGNRRPRRAKAKPRRQIGRNLTARRLSPARVHPGPLSRPPL